jgi:hypothetical protein
MAKSLKDKVTEALTEALGKEARIQLDDAGGESIHGLVLSRFFANQSATERQDHIWKFLDQHLSPLERTRVVFIVTDTPEEYDALNAEVG